MTVKELFRFGDRSKKCLKEMWAGNRGSHRQITAGKSLAHAQNVRCHALVLAGKQTPGTTESGRDLIADQKHVVAIT